MELGQYVVIDGRPAVRFVRFYQHSVERLWSAVTDPDELRHWFPSTVDFDLREGGTVSFSGDPHIADSTGRILVCDRPRSLAFTWGRDELRFGLEAVGGSCQFTLTNVLEAKDTAARNGAGWSVCLAELDAHLSGADTEGPHAGEQRRWRGYYDAYVAAGTPSGADVPL